jgi:ribonucleoside-diphosphate reductase alpha chain
MGLQDALFELDLPFDAPEAVDFSDRTMERVSYHAILASSRLAAERGRYASYAGSKWDRGLLPFDTIALLEAERGAPIEVARTRRLDWAPVYASVAAHGMRNSNTMAIAPTATIANIAGCYPCIEPIYKNLYVKANISGEFTVVNAHLVRDLKGLGLWGADMLDHLKYFDGNLQMIAGIPEPLKLKYREAFEIDPLAALAPTAARGKWIDQSQAHTVFMKGASGRKLSDVYQAAWRAGLKTTYYLRTLAASQVEKSTLDAGRFGFTQTREYDVVAPAGAPVSGAPAAAAAVSNVAVPVAVAAGDGLCRIDDPDCESCQ